MARKLCTACNTRPAAAEYNGNCEPCDTEGGWENEHSDRGHDESNTDPGCWFCHPELNRAQATYVKQERKGHHSPRRPQINHKACTHAQTPKARRECRKAFWAAKAAEQVAPPATMVGKAVTWVGSTGKALGGMVTKELDGGKVMVRSTKGTPVRVAAEKLRLA